MSSEMRDTRADGDERALMDGIRERTDAPVSGMPSALETIVAPLVEVLQHRDV